MFGRLRALGWVVIAVLYFLLAERLAASAASGLATGAWEELLFRIFLLFLVILGYAAMGYTGERQRHPVRAMGLMRREGWRRELGLGAALGWGGMVACVLPVALSGGLYIWWYWSWHNLGMLFLDIATLAAAAMAEEVAFRGYPFQRLMDATGPVLATVLAALAFGMLHLGNPDASAASTLTTILAGWLLALAYLRTRALWVGIGFHFAWNAAMGILFGLPVSGFTQFSPLVRTYSWGPAWLTGDGYGPEGGAIAIVVLAVLLVVMMLATRDLKYRWAQPVIVPGGIPVDVDAMARKQHEAAMGPQAPAEPALVQIGGVPSGAMPSVVMPRTAVSTEGVAEPAGALAGEPTVASVPEGHTAEASASRPDGLVEAAEPQTAEELRPPEGHES